MAKSKGLPHAVALPMPAHMKADFQKKKYVPPHIHHEAYVQSLYAAAEKAKDTPQSRKVRRDEEEQRFFMEKRIGKAFEQMMQAFNEMDREERKRIVERTLRDMRREGGERRDGSAWTVPRHARLHLRVADGPQLHRHRPQHQGRAAADRARVWMAVATGLDALGGGWGVGWLFR